MWEKPSKKGNYAESCDSSTNIKMRSVASAVIEKNAKVLKNPEFFANFEFKTVISQ